MRVELLAKFPYQNFLFIRLTIQPWHRPLHQPLIKESNDADTIRKTRFFHVIDHRLENMTIKDVCEQEGIKPDREKYWLKLRQRLDDVACRRRPRSDRPKKMSTDLMNQMLDSSRKSGTKSALASSN